MFGRGVDARFIALATASLLSAGMLEGCALFGLTAARRDVEGDLVKDVDFLGNGGAFSGQSDYLLRQQIETEQSPFGTLTPVLTYLMTPEGFDHDTLVPDAYRLEIWYAHHGWFDAEFEGWEVRQVRPRTRQKAGAVSLTGHLDPGPRSLVREFEISGLGTAGGGIGRVVERTGFIQPGEPFDLEGVEQTREMLRDRLRNASFAYADVTLTMEAWSDEQAVDVELIATPGISTRYGPIAVGGEEAIDEAVILDELELESGAPFRQEELGEARARILELGTFSVVSITPDLSDPTVREVPLNIEVTESRFRTVRVGGGVEYDSTVLTPHVSATFRHVNLFDQLLRLQTRVEAGYSANLGAALELATPVGEVGATLSHPRLFGSRRFGGFLTVEAEQGVEHGQFSFFNTRADLNLSWRPTKSWVVNAGPHWEQYRYLRLTGVGELVAETVFGTGFQNPYQLTAFDVNATYTDTTGDPIAPTSGRIGTIGIRQAVPLTESDYFYTEVSLDGRMYMPIRAVKSRLAAVVPEVVAFRGRAQVLQPWLGRDLPFPERAFLGGSTDLRGFRNDGVGPYTCLCVYDDSGTGDPFTNEPKKGVDVNQQYIPQGGAIAVMLATEARYDISSTQGVVAFIDAGVLAADWEALRHPPLRMGYGVGYRYRSGVGPFRVDLALRPLYPEDWGPVEFVNCQQQDRDPRPFDLLSLPQGNRQLFDRNVPFAINLYLGLGEAL